MNEREKIEEKEVEVWKGKMDRKDEVKTCMIEKIEEEKVEKWKRKIVE